MQEQCTSRLFRSFQANDSVGQDAEDHRRRPESKSTGLAPTSTLARTTRRIYSELESSAASGSAWKRALLMVICILLSGCRSPGANAGPSIEFTKVPQADEGGPDKVDTIEGRVTSRDIFRRQRWMRRQPKAVLWLP